jgi:hypothetical protein
MTILRSPWTQTENRRWLRRDGHGDTLQREWISAANERDWRDVPVVEETMMDADFSDIPIITAT